MKKGETFTVDVAFPCPTCGAQCGASANPPAVFHAEPHCKTFADLDVADFLKAAREAIERTPVS